MNNPPERQPKPHAGHRILSRENLAAAALCLILIAIVVLTSDSSPQWIYQGF